jgi:hypothetical protein
MTTIELTTPKEVSICFGDESTEWVNNNEYNGLMVKARENYLNDLLHARGFVEKNEVVRALGYQPTIENIGIYWELKNGHLKFNINPRDSRRFDIIITQI